MKVGPELDALVAEKVMGYDAHCFVDDTGQLRDAECNAVPAFSIDMGAAWKVVERVRKARDCRFGLVEVYAPMDGFRAEFQVVVGDHERVVYSDFGPAAFCICVAALKAMEAPV